LLLLEYLLPKYKLQLCEEVEGGRVTPCPYSFIYATHAGGVPTCKQQLGNCGCLASIEIPPPPLPPPHPILPHICPTPPHISPSFYDPTHPSIPALYEGWKQKLSRKPKHFPKKNNFSEHFSRIFRGKARNFEKEANEEHACTIAHHSFLSAKFSHHLLCIEIKI
jgi:hypothetical protein